MVTPTLSLPLPWPPVPFSTILPLLVSNMVELPIILIPLLEPTPFPPVPVNEIFPPFVSFIIDPASMLTPSLTELVPLLIPLIVTPPPAVIILPSNRITPLLLSVPVPETPVALIIPVPVASTIAPLRTATPSLNDPLTFPAVPFNVIPPLILVTLAVTPSIRIP